MYQTPADDVETYQAGGSVGTNKLVVEFCGEETTLCTGETLDFGRSGDLAIDENPFLHRRLGLVEGRHDMWWLRNVGSRIPLVVKDLTSRSQVTLAPGREMALTFPHVAVQFAAGKSNYELELRLDGAGKMATDTAVIGIDEDDAETISIGDLPLTIDQKRLIVVLAEPTLRSADATVDLPTNKAAAVRLGWTITRFNRKLDNVCERLTKAGVSGLRGAAGVMATDRRTRLVEHSVESGLVTVDDLALLES